MISPLISLTISPTISLTRCRRIHTLTLFALCLTLAAIGCRHNPAADDSALNSAVMARLHSDNAIANEPIETTVKDRVATLNGAVSSPAARSLAANDVAQVPGVRTVINNLSVAPAGTEAAAAAPAPPPAEIVTTPPPAPVPTVPPSLPVARQKPDTALGRRPAPVERERPPAPAAASPQFAQTVPPPPIQAAPPPPPPAPAFRNVTIPSGTTISVRMTTALDSATTQQGDSFTGTVAGDVLVDGLVAIPQGSTATGRVDTVQEAAHYKGNSLLAIELTGVTRHGERLPVVTETFSKAGAGRGKNTAEKVGGGAAVGAILGGIFGGGRGAAIGAAAGGGVGAGANTITRGQQVQIPSETLVPFKLTGPVSVRVRTSPGPRTEAPQGNPNQGNPNQDNPDRDSGPRRPLTPSASPQ